MHNNLLIQNCPAVSSLFTSSFGLLCIQAKKNGGIFVIGIIEYEQIYADLTVSSRKLSKRKIYYVYAHYRPNNEDTPFYIGKGSGVRSHFKERNNKFWTRVVEKYGGFDVRLLYDNIDDQ